MRASQWTRQINEATRGKQEEIKATLWEKQK